MCERERERERRERERREIEREREEIDRERQPCALGGAGHFELWTLGLRV